MSNIITHNGKMINDTNRLPVDASLTGSLGTQQVYAERLGTLAATTEETLIDITTPFVMQVFEWAVNNQTKGQLRLQPYVGGVATALGTILVDGSNKQGLYPSFIGSNPPSYLSIIAYDTTLNNYKFAINKEMIFAEGVKITVRNTDATNAINFSAEVFGRKLK